MVQLPFRIQCEEGRYTAILLDQFTNTGYFGTEHGCVEIWDLNDQVKLTEARYLLLDHFNEPVPVNEPVVNLDAPQDFKFVYAFMGIAAYCIDTNLRQIIQQIPISERVIFGSVSPEKGEIGVLAETGYLSRWSPRFIERTGSLDFNRKIEKAYVTHDYNESRIILVLPGGEVMLTNLEGERYIEEFQLSEAPQYVVANRYDRNGFCQAFIEPNGEIVVYDPNVVIDWVKETVFRHGVFEAAEYLRKRVNDLEIKGVDRNYVPDVRFNRQSHDRYNAERDSIGKELHHTTSEEDDSKTLDYALETYTGGDFPTKSEAMAVITRIADRYEIEPKYIQIAWRTKPEKTKLVNISRNLQEMSIRREKRYNKIAVMYLALILISLIIGMSSLNFEILVAILISLLIVTALIGMYGSSMNHNPKFNWIREYKGLRTISILIPIFMIVNHYTEFV